MEVYFISLTVFLNASLYSCDDAQRVCECDRKRHKNTLQSIQCVYAFVFWPEYACEMLINCMITLRQQIFRICRSLRINRWSINKLGKSYYTNGRWMWAKKWFALENNNTKCSDAQQHNQVVAFAAVQSTVFSFQSALLWHVKYLVSGDLHQLTIKSISIHFVVTLNCILSLFFLILSWWQEIDSTRRTDGEIRKQFLIELASFFFLFFIIIHASTAAMLKNLRATFF